MALAGDRLKGGEEGGGARVGLDNTMRPSGQGIAC